MLMKSPTPPTAAIRLVHAFDAIAGRLWLGARRLYRAIKHRRDIAFLAGQDDYMLADIGLTRDDLRHAVAQPLFLDIVKFLVQPVLNLVGELRKPRPCLTKSNVP